MEIKHARRRLLRALAWAPLVPLALGAWQPSAAAVVPPSKVLLKLDDVFERGKDLSGLWRRTIEFLVREGVAASLGVIGESLEDPSPRYLAALRSLAADTRFELWNHGFRNRFVPDATLGERREFFGTSADRQFRSISGTQQLLQSQLGIAARVFGPHASGTDDNTYAALARLPEIKAVWFYAPRSPINGLAVFKREADMEHPIFVPSLAGLQDDLRRRSPTQPYLALQGHPDMWSDERFQAFVEVVHWLRNQGCTFLRASDLL